MATDVVPVSRWQATRTFLVEAYHEVRLRTTWPDVAQIRQASIAIVIFVLIIGLVISLLDLVLQLFFVTLLPSLFS